MVDFFKSNLQSISYSYLKYDSLNIWFQIYFGCNEVDQHPHWEQLEKLDKTLKTKEKNMFESVDY